MIIYVDIDGTICDTKNGEYIKAVPLPDKIQAINALWEAGHEVVYWTARGSGTGLNWRTLTLEQLKEWGCKYTELKFGKPVYDILYDDKARCL